MGRPYAPKANANRSSSSPEYASAAAPAPAITPPRINPHLPLPELDPGPDVGTVCGDRYAAPLSARGAAQVAGVVGTHLLSTAGVRTSCCARSEVKARLAWRLMGCPRVEKMVFMTVETPTDVEGV